MRTVEPGVRPLMDNDDLTGLGYNVMSVVVAWSKPVAMLTVFVHSLLLMTRFKSILKLLPLLASNSSGMLMNGLPGSKATALAKPTA